MVFPFPSFLEGEVVFYIMLFRFFLGFGTTPLVPTTRFFHLTLDGEELELWDLKKHGFSEIIAFSYIFNLSNGQLAPPPARTEGHDFNMIST